jgi:predicted nucleic acid-binding protein
MNAEVFVDTNIFLYSIDDSPAASEKREVAREILRTEPWGWSVQVATEFFVNATSNKRSFRLTTDLAKSLVEAWLSFPTADITPDIVRAAMTLHRRFQTSYWDSAILATAKQLGCHTVYSEDLNDQQNYDGVTVVNPFRRIGVAAGPAN